MGLGWARAAWLGEVGGPGYRYLSDFCLPSEAAGVSRLASLAAEVFGLTSLEGNTPLAVEARRLAVHAARPAFTPTQIARAIGTTPRTASRLARQDVPEAGLRALKLRLSLLDRLAAPVT